jgi:hypothetical protein
MVDKKSTPQESQKASKYYPAEDVSVPKKVCHRSRQNTDLDQMHKMDEMEQHAPSGASGSTSVFSRVAQTPCIPTATEKI